MAVIDGRPIAMQVERNRGGWVLTTRGASHRIRVRTRAPLPRPRNIVCMARNYMESGALAEPDPINAFHKAPNAVIGPDETMVLPDVAASNFECEAEIAVVIGQIGRASCRERVC